MRFVYQTLLNTFTPDQENRLLRSDPGIRYCSGPLSCESGPRSRYPIAPLSYCTALSRSPALFPAPLREVSATLWNADFRLDLSSLILAVIFNTPRSLPRLICKVNLLRTFFRSPGHFAHRVFSPLQIGRSPPYPTYASRTSSKPPKPSAAVPAAASHAILPAPTVPRYPPVYSYKSVSKYFVYTYIHMHEYKRPINTKSTATSAVQPVTTAELSATAAKSCALSRGPQLERTKSTFGLSLSRHVSAEKMRVKARRPTN